MIGDLIFYPSECLEKIKGRRPPRTGENHLNYSIFVRRHFTSCAVFGWGGGGTNRPMLHAVYIPRLMHDTSLSSPQGTEGSFARDDCVGGRRLQCHLGKSGGHVLQLRCDL